MTPSILDDAVVVPLADNGVPINPEPGLVALLGVELAMLPADRGALNPPPTPLCVPIAAADAEAELIGRWSIPA